MQTSSEHSLPKNSTPAPPSGPKPSAPSAGHGLSKARRLLKRDEFQSVMGEAETSGRKFVTPCLIVFARPQPSATSGRMGIIASKKVGNAVRRNLAKRRIRESYRQLDPELTAGWDIVVIARAQTAVVAASVVDYHLGKALTKARKPAKTPNAAKSGQERRRRKPGKPSKKAGN